MRAARPGVTLLELLIAIILLLAIGAIAMPALLPLLERQAEESAVDLVLGHLLLARAEAQAGGRPVEVVYAGPPGRLVARPFDVTAGLEDDPPPDEVSVAPREDRDDDAPAIEGGWAERWLPDGLRLAADDHDDADDAERRPNPGDARDETAAVTRRLVVYLPDGAALPGEPVLLVRGARALGRFTVDPWTGTPVFEVIAAGAAGTEADPEADSLADSWAEEDDDRRAEEDAVDTEDAPEDRATDSKPNATPPEEDEAARLDEEGSGPDDAADASREDPGDPDEDDDEERPR